MNTRSETDSPTMIHSPHSRHTMPGYNNSNVRHQKHQVDVPKLGVKLITGNTGTAAELAGSVDLSFPPELSEVGTSGVYFLRDSQGKRCAVFKPIDEEYGAVRNPRGGEALRDLSNMKGFEPGHGFLKEYAAFNVSQSMFLNESGEDHPLAPALERDLVPETCVVMVPWTVLGKGEKNARVSRFKIGSLQQYVPGEDATDFGSAMFSVANVQQIALLDLRILNCDRNFGNLLVTESTNPSAKRNLKAIDHAFSFPCAFSQLDQVSFDWLMWPQVKEPIVPELRQVIANIDLNEDLERLAAMHVSHNSILSFWMATKLLQEGVEAGLTLYDIGSLCQRAGDRSQPSALEEIFLSTLEALRFPNLEESSSSSPTTIDDGGNNTYNYGDAFETEFVFQSRLSLSTLKSRMQE